MTLYANNVHQILHDSVLSTRIISSDLVSVSQCQQVRVSLAQAIHKISQSASFRGDICTMILWHSYHTNPNCFSRPKYQFHFLSFECHSRCLHTFKHCVGKLRGGINFWKYMAIHHNSKFRMCTLENCNNTCYFIHSHRQHLSILIMILNIFVYD